MNRKKKTTKETQPTTGNVWKWEEQPTIHCWSSVQVSVTFQGRIDRLSTLMVRILQSLQTCTSQPTLLFFFSLSFFGAADADEYNTENGMH